MVIYDEGKVTVNKGSATVTGDKDVFFITVGKVKIGDLFTIGVTTYQILTVVDEKNITVGTLPDKLPFQEENKANTAFSVIRNFSFSVPADIANDIATLTMKWHNREYEMLTWLGSAKEKETITNIHGVKREYWTPYGLSKIGEGADSVIEKARKWAENPVDVPVTPGHFSSLHWATKSKDATKLVITEGNKQVKRVADEAAAQIPRVTKEGDDQIDRLNEHVRDVNKPDLDTYTNTKKTEIDTHYRTVVNFKGNWADLTGALTMPAMVYHKGEYWNLTKNLADVTTSEPGPTNTDWVSTATITSYLMKKPQVNAIRQHIRDQYAASGFVHFGKHATDENSINEGLEATPLFAPYANKIYMGASEWTPSRAGNSKTDYAFLHFAGFESQWRTGGANDAYTAQAVTLPPAEKGTRTFNTATGVSFDFEKQVDPKYGDVAPNTNEAVARAFEGRVKNGDFRFGDDGVWVKLTPSDAITISKGKIEKIGTAACNDVAQSGRNVFVVGKTYETTTVVKELTGANKIIALPYDGDSSNNKFVNEAGTYTHRFVAKRPDVYFGHTPNTDSQWVVTSIEVREITNQVVTDRIDVWGVEGWLEVDNEEIFPDGNIQNTLDTFGNTGIPTEDSSRPLTYFAQYHGQTGFKKGKCVKLSKLNDKQRKAVLDYMGMLCYFDANHNIIQHRKRMRTFRGAGNGDWNNVSPTKEFLGFAHLYRVPIHASSDTVGEWVSSGSTNHYYGKQGAGERNQGDFTAYDGNGKARYSYDGESYFYVGGTVPRLNAGGHHPRFNEMGARRWNTNTANSQGEHWHSYIVIKPTSRKQCFNYLDSSKDTTNCGASLNSGKIGVLSGRPDGRFYDGIYPGGQGGVNDDRLSSWDMSSPEEKDKVKQKVQGGVYRGEEKLAFTSFIKQWTYGTETTVVIMVDPNNKSRIRVGSSSYSNVHSVTHIKGHEVSHLNANGTEFFLTKDLDVTGLTLLSRQTGWDCYTGDALLTERKGYTVSGDFKCATVTGNPVEIRKVPQLKAGWYGYWCPVFGVTADLPMVRKVKDQFSGSPVLRTADSGATWSSHASGINTNTNTRSLDASNTNVHIVPYIAFSYQTKQGASDRTKVLNREAGVGSVYTYCWNHIVNGALLFESLLGKVPVNTNNTGGAAVWYSNKLLGVAVDTTGGYVQSSAGYVPKHNPIALPSPTNNSSGMKVLDSQIENNGQCSMQFHVNELKYKFVTAEKFDPSKPKAFVAGGRYYVGLADDNARTRHEGLILTGIGNGSSTLLTWAFNGSDLVSPDADTKHPYVMPFRSEHSWGDDSKIKVVLNGTYTNINRETCIARVHELAKPYGYTRKKAEAGPSTLSSGVASPTTQSYYQALTTPSTEGGV